ncbi:MAG: MFS transporter [Clostridiales bacterium]|nr:MFS transporter [Clostridiales bacterium]
MSNTATAVSEKNWKNKFLFIWSGQGASVLASSAVHFSIIWWLTDLTGSPAVLAIAAMAGFLPQALFGPFAGVWIDRLKRKRVLIGADFFISLVSFALFLVFVLGQPSPAFIYLSLFLRACGFLMRNPSMQAIMPMLVPKSHITKVAGWNQMVQSASLMLGPVVGAALFAILPMHLLVLIDAAGALVSMIMVSLVKIPNPEKGQEQNNVLAQMKEGMLIILSKKPLVRLAPSLLLAVLIYVPIPALFPVMIKTHFIGTAWHAGSVELSFAGGLLISSLIIGLWGAPQKRFRALAISLGSAGIFLALGGILPAGYFYIFLLLALAMGFAGNTFVVLFTSYIQLIIPERSMGRVFALITSLMALATPVGLFISAPIAELIGIDRWFFYSGLAMVISGLLCAILTRSLAEN